MNYKKNKVKNSFINIDNMSYKEINRKYKVLKSFNSHFYDTMRSYGSLDEQYRGIFTEYPKKLNLESTSVSEKYTLYEKKNIEKSALKKIKKTLFYLELAERQVMYFEIIYSRAKDTKNKISNNLYQKEFTLLYKERIQFLSYVSTVARKSIAAIKNDINNFEITISELEKIPKKSLLNKSLEVGFNVLTAPVRHTLNIIDGFIEGDNKKIGKGIFMLTAGLVGIGVAVDALELLEASEGIVATETGPTHVEPHERVLPSGEVIWVDGDGDTSVNLSESEGGGYWRS